MAQMTVVTVTDDIDGSDKDVSSLRFAWDGTEYEIDLGPENRAIAEERFGTFIAHARRVTTRATTSNGSPGPRRNHHTRQRAIDIRAWAVEQGIDISERGRIPVSVQDRYDAAH